jgi:hypothetical protein
MHTHALMHALTHAYDTHTHTHTHTYTHWDIQLSTWNELASFTWALNIAVFVKDPNWHEAHVKQLQWLRKQDADSHRIPFLFDDPPSINRQLVLEAAPDAPHVARPLCRQQFLRYAPTPHGMRCTPTMRSM